MLELKKVSKKYKNTTIFNNIYLKVKKGDVISIVGPSGCGKSTLLKCINRLEEISDGEIFLNGIDIKNIKITELRKKIGMVFQEYNLFEHLTVLENLIIGLTKIKTIPKEEAIKEAEKILKVVDLTEKKNNYPDELSGGQKQRIAIARTLLMKPEIILLDEPTSALDKEMKKEVLKLIKNMVKEDMTLIIVSHEEEFINKVSDKIYEIRKNGIKEIK